MGLQVNRTVGLKTRSGWWPRLLARVGLTTTNEMERQIAETAAEYEADDTGYNNGFEDGKQEAVWRGSDGIPIEYWQSLGPHPEHKD